MIGAYLGTWSTCSFRRRPARRSRPSTVLGAVLAGLYVERLCFAPMAAGAGIASMVSSFAIWMQLEQAAILVAAAPHLSVPAARDRRAARARAVPAARRSSDHARLRARAVGRACSSLLYRTRFGLALRAIIDNPVAAHLVGIDVRPRVSCCAFALASAIGGVAGFLVLAIDQQVTPMFGMWATIKGLIAMMIGGLGSLPGAILGGLAARRRRGAQPMVLRPADARPRRLPPAVRLPGAAAGRPARRARRASRRSPQRA